MTSILYDKASRIDKQYIKIPLEDVLTKLWQEDFPKRICLASSFGTEAVILLYYVSKIDKKFPIIFLDSLKLFPETIVYRNKLIDRLSLENVKTITPDEDDINIHDHNDDLWKSNSNLCCHIRKVIPMEKALENYDAWITGRKRYQGGLRTRLPFTEIVDGRLKINPLAQWRQKDIDIFIKEHDLPGHPLLEKGYKSVGCMPCTAVPKDNNVRSGRWAGQEQEECGIHLGKDRRVCLSKALNNK